MESTNINLQLYDLTGKVSVVDGIAKFNGNYSSVLLGALNGRYVAIKVIKATHSQQTSTMERKLLREVVLWGSARHRNIHPFYGVARDPSFGPVGALISPWCSNGDASLYLAHHGPNMVMAARIILWKGVIDGVVYLHTRDPPIVHGDLKPGNVLIDDAGKPRICDFGLSRIFDDIQGSGMTTTSEHTGTTRYLAPELVNSNDSVPPTLESDVYALGCLALEFIYLQRPFSHRPNNPRGHLMILQDLRGGSTPAEMPPHYTWPSRRLWHLASGLWNLDPLYRPSAFTVAQEVKCTEFTLPPNVVQKVIAFVDADYNRGGRLFSKAWATRTQRLRSICLVSKACCAWATPVLYRHLWLPDTATATDLLTLSYPLTNSIVSPLPFSQVADGYGMHTESLVINCTESLLRGSPFSAGLRYLLQLTPRLRLIHIGEWYNAPILRSLATLCIYCPQDLGPTMDLAMVLPVFPCVQRLEIYIHRRAISRGANLLSASPILLLPHLRVISVNGMNESLPSFLGALSGWRLPSLQRLDFMRVEDVHHLPLVVPFLRRHGPLLRHATLDYWGYDDSDVKNLLSNIFTACINLQSVTVNLMNFRAVDRFPSHPNLEEINIEYVETEEERAEMPKRIHSFKSMSQRLFPKLLKASFRENDLKLAALFHTGDNFFTFLDGGLLYRQYDGGETIKITEADLNVNDEQWFRRFQLLDF